MASTIRPRGNREVKLNPDAHIESRAVAVGLPIEALLAGLAAHVPTIATSPFLAETAGAFSGGAYRSAIVMGWNLMYDHFLAGILSCHLAQFNAVWTANGKKAITTRGKIQGAREMAVLGTCSKAGILSEAEYRAMRDRFHKRSHAAHTCARFSVDKEKAERYLREIVADTVLGGGARKPESHDASLESRKR